MVRDETVKLRHRCENDAGFRKLGWEQLKLRLSRGKGTAEQLVWV